MQTLRAELGSLSVPVSGALTLEPAQGRVMAEQRKYGKIAEIVSSRNALGETKHLPCFWYIGVSGKELKELIQVINRRPRDTPKVGGTHIKKGLLLTAHVFHQAVTTTARKGHDPERRLL